MIRRGWAFVWARRRALIGVIVALVIVSLLIWLGYTQGWTGFRAYTDPKGDYHPAKTLWDWMGLLIIPIVLAVGGLLFSQAERRAEREAADRRTNTEREASDRRAKAESKIADDRNRETILQNYLDKMTELLLQHDLARSGPSSEVSNIARARTVTTLRQMDATRMDLLLRFLRHAHLINKGDPVQLLQVAELAEADLSGAHLSKATLCDATLSQAKLNGADLSEADLREANLSEAKLNGANLNGADLRLADMSRADLGRANLRFADLRLADLRGANLSEADLRGADLSEADLREANLSGANLNETRYDDATQWSKDFIPPPEAIKVERENTPSSTEAKEGEL